MAPSIARLTFRTEKPAKIDWPLEDTLGDIDDEVVDFVVLMDVWVPVDGPAPTSDSVEVVDE